MGSRSATDTVLGVLAALIEHRTLQQAELANSLGVKSETIRKHMLELKEHVLAPSADNETGKSARLESLVRSELARPSLDVDSFSRAAT